MWTEKAGIVSLIASTHDPHLDLQPNNRPLLATVATPLYVRSSSVKSLLAVSSSGMGLYCIYGEDWNPFTSTRELSVVSESSLSNQLGMNPINLISGVSSETTLIGQIQTSYPMIINPDNESYRDLESTTIQPAVRSKDKMSNDERKLKPRLLSFFPQFSLQSNTETNRNPMPYSNLTHTIKPSPIRFYSSPATLVVPCSSRHIDTSTPAPIDVRKVGNKAAGKTHSP
jgi:hypothetical protein